MFTFARTEVGVVVLLW